MNEEKLKKFVIILVVIISAFALHVNFVSGSDNFPITDNYSITPSPTPTTDQSINDDDNYEITDEALKLDIQISNQAFMSRKITVQLTIDPLIDSGKAAVDWFYDSNLFTVDNDDRNIITLTKDNKLIVKKNFYPITKYQRTENFNSKITAKVTATAYDINYLSTRILNFSMNPKYEVTPLLTGYSQIKTVALYGSIVLIVLSASSLIAFFSFLLNKFLIYLNTDEEK